MIARPVGAGRPTRPPCFSGGIHGASLTGPRDGPYNASVRMVDLARVCAAAVAAAMALGAAASGAAQAGRQPETRPPAPSSGHQRMLALLQEIADDTPDTHPYIGDWRARQFREELRALPATDTGPNRWRVMVQLSGEELRLGNEAEAIRLLTDALELIPRTAENRPGLDFNNYRLGVAYLRLAETQNCALHPNADACILPLRGSGIHRLQTPSRQAIAAFTEVLRSTGNAASGALSGARPAPETGARARRRRPGTTRRSSTWPRGGCSTSPT